MSKPKYNRRVVSAWFIECGIPAPVYEYRFHHTRQWRFDMAWPDDMVALEVEGLGGGRHQRTAGFVADMEKRNTATRMGWAVLQTTNRDLCMLETAILVRETMAVHSMRVGLDLHDGL